jgi:hypothetical protein
VEGHRQGRKRGTRAVATELHRADSVAHAGCRVMRSEIHDSTSSPGATTTMEIKTREDDEATDDNEATMEDGMETR